MAFLVVAPADAAPLIDLDVGGGFFAPRSSLAHPQTAGDVSVSLDAGAAATEDVAIFGRAWAAVGGEARGGVDVRAEYALVSGRVYVGAGVGYASALVFGPFPGFDTDHLESTPGPAFEGELRYFFSLENKGSGVSLAVDFVAVPVVLDSQRIDSWYRVGATLGYRWML